MNYKPFNNILVVLESAEENTTDAGIILTKENEEHNLLNVTVIEDANNFFYEGEKLCISKYAGVRFNRGNRDYALVTTDDVLMRQV